MSRPILTTLAPPSADATTYYVEYRVKVDDDGPIPRSSVIVHQHSTEPDGEAWLIDPENNRNLYENSSSLVTGDVFIDSFQRVGVAVTAMDNAGATVILENRSTPSVDTFPGRKLTDLSQHFYLTTAGLTTEPGERTDGVALCNLTHPTQLAKTIWFTYQATQFGTLTINPARQQLRADHRRLQRHLPPESDPVGCETGGFNLHWLSTQVTTSLSSSPCRRGLMKTPTC